MQYKLIFDVKLHILNNKSSTFQRMENLFGLDKLTCHATNIN